MAKVGVINLGIKGDYLKEFLSSLREVLGSGRWDEELPIFDYKKLDPGKIIQFCDTIVLSPGTALVGLDTDERFERDPGIRPLYKFIRDYVEKNPLLGINAGHEALNCAYNWAIDKIPENMKEGCKKRQDFDLSKVNDPLVKGIDSIIMELTNNFAVLPKDKQKERPGQNEVIQLTHHKDYPLISKIETGAPVYGVQFNIQPETEKVFENFFKLAYQNLQNKSS